MIRFVTTSPLPKGVAPHDLDRLGRVLASALRMRGAREVGLRTVTEPAMEGLNRQYRGKTHATDVLSFEAPVQDQSVKVPYLGDLVICPAYAKREAKRRSIEEGEEFIRLLAHGVLHLVGYDHATQKDEETMFGIQERVVTKVCG